ncbi:helix-turn-helix domain-containing protein [Magnetovibrio blakemorei]|uniref:Helix-turn-helix domain-containing protein n=1 Tax=Magnetovibrio blakemorei TaxID=28181 RepID=A0A1E5Q6J5_9PROT|nr:helix-turn-helix domain-containing protein [Magnetovibrio blakemorei]OEJ66585.1 hypothetical protein BEN30_12050 [Magnetovibrio blakemorei]
MSLDATIWAWQQEKISSSEKLVLLSMADRANENHICWPSVTRLSKDTCLHRETIMKAVENLSKAGKIEVIKKGGRNNRYLLIGVKCSHERAYLSDQSRKPDQSEKSYQDQSEKSYQNQSENPDSNLSKNLSKKPSTSSTGGRRLFSDSIFLKAEKRWPEYDIDSCYQQWSAWTKEETKKNGTVIKNLGAAFLGWMQTDAKDNPPSPPTASKIAEN